MFAAGAPRGLIGEPARNFTGAETSPAEFRLDSPELFSSVKPGSSSVPSLMTGTVTGPVTEGAPMAIAVNGRVQAVASTFQDGDTLRLGVMVPPAAFARGPNAVTAYLRGAGSSLTALRSERVVTYRLEDRDGHVVLVGGGDELPVGAGALKGFVEKIDKQDGSLVVSGWARTPGEGARRRGCWCSAATGSWPRCVPQCPGPIFRTRVVPPTPSPGSLPGLSGTQPMQSASGCSPCRTDARPSSRGSDGPLGLHDAHRQATARARAGPTSSPSSSVITPEHGAPAGRRAGETTTCLTSAM